MYKELIVMVYKSICQQCYLFPPTAATILRMLIENNTIVILISIAINRLFVYVHYIIRHINRGLIFVCVFVCTGGVQKLGLLSGHSLLRH